MSVKSLECLIKRPYFIVLVEQSLAAYHWSLPPDTNLDSTLQKKENTEAVASPWLRLKRYCLKYSSTYPFDSSLDPATLRDSLASVSILITNKVNDTLEQGVAIIHSRI